MRAFRQFWFWWIYWWRLYRSQVHPTRVSFWLFQPTFSFKAFSYFTFSSFCKNFVGKADNEHNGTIKREGSLFFGDERSLSKIVQTWKTKKNEDGVRVTFAKMHFPLEREISEQKSARYYSLLQISSYYRSITCTHLRYWYIQWKKRWQISLSRLSPASRGPSQLLRRHCEITANFLFGLSSFASHQ